MWRSRRKVELKWRPVFSRDPKRQRESEGESERPSSKWSMSSTSMSAIYSRHCAKKSVTKI